MALNGTNINIPLFRIPKNGMTVNNSAKPFSLIRMPVNDVFIKNPDTLKKSVSFTSRCEETKLNPQTPPYADKEKFALYLEKKIEKELNECTSKDAEKMIEEVATKTEVSRNEAAEVISRMNAFSGWSQLGAMEKSIKKLDVNGIFDSYHDCKESALGLTKETTRNKKVRFGKLCINDVMTYLSLKKHLIEYDRNAPNKILFIDDSEIERLKEIKEKNQYLFGAIKQQVENGSIKLAFFDGWNAKSEGKNVAQSLLGTPISPEESAIAVIKRMKEEGITLDEALNGDTVKEIQSIFDENVEINIMKNEELPGSSPVEIAEKMSTAHPSAADIFAAESAIIEQISFSEYPEADKTKALELLNKYLDSMLFCHSAKSINEYMKNLHAQIVETAEKDGKTEDDILYVIPSQGKSFELLNYQYAKANNIDISKFIYYNAFDLKDNDIAEKRICHDVTGKTLVLIDDIVGSGNSMINQEFKYSYFENEVRTSKQKTNMIFCPLIATHKGLSKIKEYTEWSERRGRTVPDRIIVGKKSDYSEFEKTLTSQEKQLIGKMLGGCGYGESYFCTAMPYMLPDNNAPASALILLPFLKNPLANKNREFTDILSETVKQYKPKYPASRS